MRCSFVWNSITDIWCRKLKPDNRAFGGGVEARFRSAGGWSSMEAPMPGRWSPMVCLTMEARRIIVEPVPHLDTHEADLFKSRCKSFKFVNKFLSSFYLLKIRCNLWFIWTEIRSLCWWGSGEPRCTGNQKHGNWHSCRRSCSANI